MARTLAQLASDLNAKADSLEEEANELAIDTAMVMITHLALTTPTDTTEAVSNWQVSLNTPVPTSGRIRPHTLGGERSREITIGEAADILNRKKPGENIYISNVREDYNYIIRLNEGSSDQHPGGFIEQAVMLGREHVKEASL